MRQEISFKKIKCLEKLQRYISRQYHQYHQDTAILLNRTLFKNLFQSTVLVKYVHTEASEPLR